MIRNYLNYAGSKDRYYPLIREFFQRALGRKKRGKYLIDLFCGSGVVSANSLDMFDYVVAVDNCKELITIHNWVLHTDYSDIYYQIQQVINAFKLSKDNKDGFLALRKDYNYEHTQFDVISPAKLYCLITHSFNYSLHLNKKGEYNCPAGTGRSYFNKSLESKLRAYKEHVVENKDTVFSFFNADVFSFAKTFNEEYIKEAVFFIDPPYSAAISKHPYRVGGMKWGEDEDRRLFELLDYINEQGGKFVFTNVFSNNGVANLPLQKWSEKYHVHRVGVDYSNCNYQRLNRGDTDEVIVYNFT